MYTQEELELLEKVADLVNVNCRHTFSAEELAQESQALALAANEKTSVEAEKKIVVADYGNKIKTLDGQIKLHAGHVASGFTYKDKPCTMYRDYEKAKRVYVDKGTNEVVKVEDFHHSDFQKQLAFKEESERLLSEDIERQNQIEENNRAGMYAEGYAPGLDALDGVILDKKIGKKEKPTPKDNLHPNHGRDQEEPELPGDDIFAPIKDE